MGRIIHWTGVQFIPLVWGDEFDQLAVPEVFMNVRVLIHLLKAGSG